jgi:hypothetical protein
MRLGDHLQWTGAPGNDWNIKQSRCKCVGGEDATSVIRFLIKNAEPVPGEPIDG